MKKYKSLLLLAIIVALMVGVSVRSLIRLEVTQSYYESYIELVSVPNILEAGWVPDWIPKSATEINESHDIDTNEAWVVLDFLKDDDFYSGCQEISSDSIQRPSKTRANHFPIFVGNAIDAIYNNENLRFYDCSKNTKRFMAIDEIQSKAYIWALPR